MGLKAVVGSSAGGSFLHTVRQINTTRRPSNRAQKVYCLLDLSLSVIPLVDEENSHETVS